MDNQRHQISGLRILVSICLPPAAVIDRGCGAIIIVSFLTVLGWIPGVIAALAFNLTGRRQQRYVDVPVRADSFYEKPKREAQYMRLADGTWAEIVDAGESNGDWDDDLLAQGHDDLAT
jgi:uncharacterized membrane protein YqaE (UPF0057 family)